VTDSTACNSTVLKPTTGAHDDDGNHCHNIFKVLAGCRAAFVVTPEALDSVNEFPCVNPGLTRYALPDANSSELLKYEWTYMSLSTYYSN
jgi:hypothetical protein